MQVFLYYVKDKIKLKYLLVEEIKQNIMYVYKKKREEIDNFEYHECENLVIGKNNFDYFLMIKTDNAKEFYDKKSNLEEMISNSFKKYGYINLIGSVEFDPSFNPDSIIKPGVDEVGDEIDYKKRSKLYIPKDPLYTFDRVILSEDTIRKIDEAINILKYENKVFKEWGLSVIEPNPSTALSFYGPSGTGKTMAAEAVANKLGKKILKASYADIESKYHGEGPKMVKAIFYAAQENDAVLFIDEADSLLSKRLTNVTQGSEQAINSMRSQLLICLEDFRGIVVFATNLVENYDPAFLTRLISVKFEKPDVECRKKIWDVHIKPINNNGINIPLADDVNTLELAEEFDFCGRQIRRAVVSACVVAAMNNKNEVTQNDFINASKRVLDENLELVNNKDNLNFKKLFDEKEKKSVL